MQIGERMSKGQPKSSPIKSFNFFRSVSGDSEENRLLKATDLNPIEQSLDKNCSKPHSIRRLNRSSYLSQIQIKFINLLYSPCSCLHIVLIPPMNAKLLKIWHIPKFPLTSKDSNGICFGFKLFYFFQQYFTCKHKQFFYPFHYAWYLLMDSRLIRNHKNKWLTKWHTRKKIIHLYLMWNIECD